MPMPISLTECLVFQPAVKDISCVGLCLAQYGTTFLAPGRSAHEMRLDVAACPINQDAAPRSLNAPRPRIPSNTT
jgi:hypothetical protein